MGSAFTLACACIHLVLILFMLMCACKAQLNSGFYQRSCPNLAGIVRRTISANLIRDPTAPAALLRLFFHDCQVQGCDASLLLDTQGGIVSERESSANFGIRRLDFIDAIKASVENACPNTVSCADLVVLAAREAVNIAGGPFIEVPLGRRDGVTASSARASAELPSADIGFNGFLKLFRSKGMSTEESVAILGAHTLGVGHCVNVESRLYPEKDNNLGLVFYNVLKLRCPARRTTQGRVVPNDLTPVTFDTQYFGSALAGRGLFRVDSEVARNPLTAPILQFFKANPAAFFSAFSSAFVKLSLSDVLVGSQGQIRSNCHFVN
eukprot:c20661_g2_i1 orf=49-1017(-)